MAWSVLCFVLTIFLVGFAGYLSAMAKQVRELQRWRDDVSALCRQHLEEKDG